MEIERPLDKVGLYPTAGGFFDGIFKGVKVVGFSNDAGEIRDFGGVDAVCMSNGNEVFHCESFK